MPGQHTTRIELQPASREERPVLENLLELYLHDFSEFLAVDLGPAGRFGYPGLDRYWSDPNRAPFLIFVEERLAGFVLVTQEVEAGDEPFHDVSEFFVSRGFRRMGVGLSIARQVWQRFPGRWQVRVMESNHPACFFWQRAVEEFVGAAVTPGRMEHLGFQWRVFRFRARPVSGTPGSGPADATP
jgi:predicted acetyltransferase